MNKEFKGRKYHIKTGDKFGNWTIVDIDYNSRFHAICQCQCGEIRKKKIDELFKDQDQMCSKCFFKAKKAQYFREYKVIPHFIFTQIKANASTRGLQFDLDLNFLENLLEVQNFKCAISGLPISGPTELFVKDKKCHYNRKNTTISLDRIDNSSGYIKGNVQWVHKQVNIMKGTLKDEHFITLCKIISEYNQDVALSQLEEISKDYRHGVKKLLN